MKHNSEVNLLELSELEGSVWCKDNDVVRDRIP